MMTVRIAATMLALSLAGPALAQNVGGAYRVEGTNFDGTPYRGTANIRLTSQTTCEITWNTGSTSQGICMRNRDAVSAAYRFDQSGTIGLAIYRVLPDGTLDGIWTLAGRNGAGTERLMPVQ